MSKFDNIKKPARNISKSEAELWQKITDTTTPLEKQKQDAIEENSQTEPEIKKDKSVKKYDSPSPQYDKSQSLLSTDVRSIENFDHKNIRKIVKGKHTIDAKLDLHGLTQHEAHRKVKSFLKNSQRKGLRIVLIITGKGKRQHHTENNFWMNNENHRGVLQKMLPYWLSEPDCLDLIVSYTQAHPRHGGSGALYVHLRKTHKTTK